MSDTERRFYKTIITVEVLSEQPHYDLSAAELMARADVFIAYTDVQGSFIAPHEALALMGEEAPKASSLWPGVGFTEEDHKKAKELLSPSPKQVEVTAGLHEGDSIPLLRKLMLDKGMERIVVTVWLEDSDEYSTSHAAKADGTECSEVYERVPLNNAGYVTPASLAERVARMAVHEAGYDRLYYGSGQVELSVNESGIDADILFSVKHVEEEELPDQKIIFVTRDV